MIFYGYFGYVKINGNKFERINSKKNYHIFLVIKTY